MHIVCISEIYPVPSTPKAGVFVKELLLKFKKLGCEVSVIVPISYYKCKNINSDVEVIEDDGIKIYMPKYLSFSNVLLPFNLFSTYSLTANFFYKAVEKVFIKYNLKPSIVYGHFLFPSGYSVSKIGKITNTPTVVAIGESNLNNYQKHFSINKLKKLCSTFDKIISVSKKNSDFFRNNFGVDEEKIIVLPNCVDLNVFRKLDKIECREKLNLPKDDAIVIFVGHFNERKGVLRVLRAIKKNPDVKAIFIGHGAQVPTGNQVLYAGTVKHEDLAIWLNSADIFVLPTMAEGCPNAIIEALACDIPIVSSNIEEIKEFFEKEKNVFLVDPVDECQIGNTIRYIIKNKNIIEKVERNINYQYDINERAKKIIDIFKNIMVKEI